MYTTFPPEVLMREALTVHNPSYYTAARLDQMTVMDMAWALKQAGIDPDEVLEQSLGLATAVDAKGDILIGTGADAVARLPVGAAGQFLVPDSSQATGMKWRSSHIVDVRDHGAVGNGIADDTVAIQAAINVHADHPAAVFGGITLLPPGDYLISAALTIPNGVHLMGSGPSATRILCKASTTFVGGAIKNADVSGGQEYMFVSNLAIIGNKANSAVVPAGILMDTVYVNSFVRDVVVAHCSGFGLQIKCETIGGAGGNSGPILVENSWFHHNNDHNIDIRGQVNSAWLRNITVENQAVGKAGIHIKGPLYLPGSTSGVGHTLHSIHYEIDTADASTYGIWLEDAVNVTVEGVTCSAGTVGSLIRISGAISPDDQFHSGYIVVRNSNCGGLTNNIKDDSYGATITAKQVAEYHTPNAIYGATFRATSSAANSPSVFFENHDGSVKWGFVWDGTAFRIRNIIGAVNALHFNTDGSISLSQKLDVSGVGITLPDSGAGTPTGGTNGDIRIGDSKIWINDSGTWKSVAVA